MKISVKCVILFCLLLSILTGCKDMRDIDRITFPFVLGIDYDEQSQKLKLYAQVSTLAAQAGGQSQGASKYGVLEGEGKTLREAMSDLGDHAQQYISWKQLIAVIFTDKMAKHGLYNELDTMSRMEQIHLNSYLILTTDDLKDLLGTSTVIETGLPSNVIGVMLMSEQSTHTKAFTMKEFIVSTLTNEVEPVLPLLYIYRTEQSPQDKKIEIAYKGLGVFYDGKLVGWLDEEETGSFLFASGVNQQGTVTVPYPEAESGEISVSELTTKVKETPILQGDTPGMTLKIDAIYDIYSYVGKKEIGMEAVKNINTIVSEHIKKHVEHLVHKTQNELKADIFGFGRKFYRKYPKYWKESEQHWDEIYPTIKVDVAVQAKLRDTGELGNSFKHKLGKD
ncbi:MAG: Ger(x)C family spore germination protein [Hyphomonadaceae bacterium]|nr:Ger(x)C family spore germination protein [Clostridia bacterium]